MHLRSKGCLRWGINEMPLIAFWVFFFKVRSYYRLYNEWHWRKQSIPKNSVSVKSKLHNLTIGLEKSIIFLVCVCVCICVCVHACVRVLNHSAMSDSCSPMDCSLPDSSVRGILQAKILEEVASPPSRRSSWPKNQTHISCVFCIGQVGSGKPYLSYSPHFLRAWTMYIQHLK